MNIDMPIGLKFALTQDLNALNKFSSMSETQQASFIEGAHQVKSKQEMQAYVNSLSG